MGDYDAHLRQLRRIVKVLGQKSIRRNSILSLKQKGIVLQVITMEEFNEMGFHLLLRRGRDTL